VVSGGGPFLVQQLLVRVTVGRHQVRHATQDRVQLLEQGKEEESELWVKLRLRIASSCRVRVKGGHGAERVRTGDGKAGSSRGPRLPHLFHIHVSNTSPMYIVKSYLCLGVLGHHGPFALLLDRVLLEGRDASLSI
jgi:hypothetical protein